MDALEPFGNINSRVSFASLFRRSALSPSIPPPDCFFFILFKIKI